MDIILRQDYPALGFTGDQVSVKSGYARNYLIPGGIALEYTSRNAKSLKNHLKQIDVIKGRLKAEAEALADKLKAVTLNFDLKLGETGKSFGSITGKDIFTALTAQGFELDRKQVKLGDSIKSGGQFEVEVKLHSEVSAAVPVIVKVEAAAVKKVKKSKGEVIAAEGADSEESSDAEAVDEYAEAEEVSEAGVSESED